MSDSVRPHRRQLTRLPHPWDSPGKNTGVGSHFILQGIVLSQGSNLHLLCVLHWQVGSSHERPWEALSCLLVVVFSPPVTSHSLRPHGLQDARPVCPSPSPEVCPSSCPLHQWYHPAISPFDALFSFCPQSFPASGTFPEGHLFASDDQNTGVSASASILPKSIWG